MALSEGVLLDTHTWIWLRFGLLDANPEALAAIREAAETETWFVCSFSFYEIAHAVRRKRLHLNMPLLEWLQSASTLGLPVVLEITPEVTAATLSLPTSFHGDPGDRVIAATAIANDLTLCTHDKAMLRFAKQGFFRALKVNEKKVAYER